MNTGNNYAFPIVSTASNEEIKANYWKCLYTSADKKMLQYWVILPNRVKPAELTPQHLPEVGLTNLGRYATDDAQPYMEVWAAYERCQWEMNPSDWLFNKLELMGEKVLNQRLIAHPSGCGLFADVLTLKTHSSGDEVISRYTVQKDYNPQEGGGNYFLIKAACAARDYPALANDIYFTVVNWDLLHRSNLVLAELLKTVNLSAKNSSGFKVPESWQVNPLTETRLVVEHSFDGINYGVINLCFFRRRCCLPRRMFLAFRLNGFTIENLPLRLRLKHLLLFQMSLIHPSEKHCGHAGGKCSAQRKKCALFTSAIFLAWAKSGAMQN